MMGTYKLNWTTSILMLTSIFMSGNCLLCDDLSDSEATTAMCARLSKDLERALLEDEGNLFRMRKAFFYSPTASPVLLKVVYNITYGENFTDEVPCCYTSFMHEETTKELYSESCVNVTMTASVVNATTCMPDKNINCCNSIEVKQKNYTYGWTSTGVYVVFHPIVLTMMQAQTPIVALRIVHKTYNLYTNQRSPEADTFLWDGSYELPTLHINLHITSLSCIPTEDLFTSVLKDFNTLLKLYAAQQKVLSFARDTDTIGFTLPDTSVTTTKVPMESGVVMSNIYSSALWLLYAASVIMFLVWYHKKDIKRHAEENGKEEDRERNGKENRKAKETIHKWIDNNKSLTVGIFTTAVTVGMFDGTARIASCIIWTHYAIEKNTTFLAVWLPQIFALTCGTIVLIGCHCIECCVTRCKCETDLYIHIILPIYLIAFGCVYYLFPTFILVLAYPTQMIATIAFVLAYLFATTILSAILYKWYEHCCEQYCEQCCKKCHKQCYSGKWYKQHKPKQRKPKPQLCKITLLYFVALIGPIWIILLYVQLIAIVFLYSLLIGRGSAINTGPLFAISLLPSLLLSGVAWLAKRVAFPEMDNKDDKSTQ